MKSAGLDEATNHETTHDHAILDQRAALGCSKGLAGTPAYDKASFEAAPSFALIGAISVLAVAIINLDIISIVALTLRSGV